MKAAQIEFIEKGTVTSPKGFFAGATYAGIKKEKGEGVFDLGILYSEIPCLAASMFTTNKVQSHHVPLCKERLRNGRAVAMVANSGVANTFNGEQGLRDATEMAELTANIIGADAEDVLMASTGVTGYPMPMELIRAGISKIALSHDGGHDIAKAIMTTDTIPKEVAVSVKIGETEITIGGIAKGSGMIHPNMATMLCFLTTDAALELDFLKSALKESVDKSINMIDIDLDTSPSDMTLLMANGLAKNKPVSAGSQEAATFQQALDQVCIYLAKALAHDGEGATKLIEVTVEGAATIVDARLAAKAVVSSPLVKTAIYGTDPNWGRIVVAMGGSGVEIDESRIDLYIGEANPLKDGRRVPHDSDEIVRVFQQSNVPIRLNLNMGTSSATAWGCDLTEEYVSINSQYMT